MRHTRALATTLGMVLVLFLCLLPAVIGCEALFVLGLGEVLGAVAIVCFAVAGAAARPRGSARLGALLGAGLYLLPGMLIVSYIVSYEVLGENFEWVGLRILLWWPSWPLGLLNCFGAARVG